MESYIRLIKLRDSIKYSIYRNSLSMALLKDQINEIRQFVGILELVTKGFNPEDELINILEDEKELESYSNPKEAYIKCRDELIWDLDKIIDQYQRFL
ncbi:hypothetical protein LLH06_03475 [Mucilaginibacter daejeonensis]|uniref:hypothetical protein n=1 Tax=Mucilaginibacter daejeonensis TaxID=398049 RepID=UPI001D1786BB|nr:hypothetical protein [Mucilaginibacter daejeonensis]UEG54031.1 hypothetical protein LLH06_03475 [Mucilaginibacter daejeonensis]